MRLTILAPLVVLSWHAASPVRAAITTFGGVTPDYDGTDPWVIGGEHFVPNGIFGLFTPSSVTVTGGSQIQSGSGG